MAQIVRRALQCPKCNTEFVSQWGSETDQISYANLPDDFGCVNCGTIITLTRDQQIDKRVDIELSKGASVIFLGTLALIGILVFLISQRIVHFYSVKNILVFSFITLLLTYMICGTIKAVRSGRIRKRIEAEIDKD